MKAIKVFNNNSVSVIMPNGREAVVVGSGIGFRKRPGETLETAKIEKIYYIQNELQTKFLQLLDNTRPEFLQAAEAILARAEQEKLSVRTQVLIALTDHLSFAAERMERGVSLPNLMNTEIKLLYPVEFGVGTWALEEIDRICGLRLPEDEAGYIALHLVNASTDCTNAYETLKFVNDALEIIQKTYRIELDEDSLDTMRLRTHLKFLAGRILSGEIWQDEDTDEMFRMLLKSNRKNRECMDSLKRYIQEEFKYTINQQEEMYLLIHITKILQTKHRR